MTFWSVLDATRDGEEKVCKAVQEQQLSRVGRSPKRTLGR